MDGAALRVPDVPLSLLARALRPRDEPQGHPTVEALVTALRLGSIDLPLFCRGLHLCLGDGALRKALEKISKARRARLQWRVAFAVLSFVAACKKHARSKATHAPSTPRSCGKRPRPG